MFIIISSPSGGGKNTIIRELLKIYPQSFLFITTTTREAREKEKNNKDYYFISKKEFEKKIKSDDFVEYNFYNDNYYGIDKIKMEKIRQKKSMIFFAIDVNGKKSFDKKKIEHFSIFILPESLAILEERIRQRGSISESQIKDRLKLAKKELKIAQNYDYKIVNKQGKLDETVKKIKKIIDKILAKELGLDKS
jgi:guanylate kinase